MAVTPIDTADPGELRVRFLDTDRVIAPGEALTIGREADLAIDDNPHMHRVVAQVICAAGLWWIQNVGRETVITVRERDGSMQAKLQPGSELPLVYPAAAVRFRVGRARYEIDLELVKPLESPGLPLGARNGTDTVPLGRIELTTAQRLVLVALCERHLRGRGEDAVAPSNKEIAERLGWSVTKVGRKIDNVCGRFAAAGVPDLKGDAASPAAARRRRLIDHAVVARIVSVSDLALLPD